MRTTLKIPPKLETTVDCLGSSYFERMKSDCFLLDGTVIGFLNDQRWNEDCFLALFALRESVTYKRNGCVAASSDLSEIRPKFRILDQTPHFSLLPIQSLLLLADEVCVVAQDLTNRALYSRLLSANGIEAERLLFDDEEGDSGEREGWNVVIADVVESSGCLRQHILEDIALARLDSFHLYGLVLFFRVNLNSFDKKLYFLLLFYFLYD